MTSYQEGDSTSPRDHGDGLGCLVPLIGLTIALAIAVTLISWFWVDVQEDQAQPADASVVDAGDASSATSSARSSASSTTADQAVVEDSPSGVSSQALIEVVESLGWRSFGKPEVYDLGSQQRVARKFHRDDQQVRLIVQTYNSQDASRSALDEVAPPAQAIQFDHKAIVVEPVDRESRPAVASLIERLRQYRELLGDQRDQPTATQ